MARNEIEAVARALYEAQECARGWDREPEMIKARFLNVARNAIETLDEHRAITPPRDIVPLVVTGDIRAAREFLMQSPDVSALSIRCQQTCRVVLRGPDLSIEAANEAFCRAAGREGFVGMPAREAFPELREQGYFQLLDQVYQTRKAFVGSGMPILFQPRKGGPLEEHITDFIYRPIEDDAGRVTGLFIESHDRTEWSRA